MEIKYWLIRKVSLKQKKRSVKPDKYHSEIQGKQWLIWKTVFKLEFSSFEKF